MYLILDDGTNVCGTVDELLDFLNKYKTQCTCSNKIVFGSTNDNSYIKALKCIKATGVCPPSGNH